jgi:hypothetical protein
MTVKPPNALLPDKAILIATEEELEEKSPWYSDGKYEFRFIRVPQFLYSMAVAHLRSQLRGQKPKPPIVRKSGREMTNKADPRYIEDLDRWKQEWQDLSQEANISTSMFRGVEVRGGIPKPEEWLEDVLKHFESIGITEEQAKATFYHSPDRLHELWFKKFVILRSKAVMEMFGDFQGGSEEDDDTEEGEDAEFAIDLFPDEEIESSS